MQMRQINWSFGRSTRVAGILLVGIIAAVACGASGKKGDRGDAKSTPLAPLNYDPQISLSPLVEQVGPAVVNIKISKKIRGHMGFGGPDDLFEFFFGPRPDRRFPSPRQQSELEQQAMGSGFVIDKKGYVVTNHHVVSGADEIEVTLSDERTFKADVVGSDERTDLALLKLNDASDLPTVKFGDSSKLKVGDRVVAIGNPFGLDHTVTSGIVSAKERVIGAGPYDDFIQTDASINPGNSGGPLFNLSGEVVGINTAINRAGQGIGFAIPSDLAEGLIESIRYKGKVVRGWLGIVFQPLDEELAAYLGAKDAKGALVTKVNGGSPAEKAGVRERDIIVGVNGEKLKSSRDLPAMVATLKPGKTSTISVLRDGKPREIKVKIGEMPDSFTDLSLSGPGADSGADLGLKVVPLDERVRKQLGADAVDSGVVVSEVDPSGGAASILSRGDIITEVNRSRVGSVEDFERVVKGLKSGDDMLVKVFRRGGWMYKVIRL